MNFKRVSDRENALLEADFSLDEVTYAVSNYDGNKAPGPDGFNLNFIKAHWAVIQDDFMCCINEFHRDGSIVKDLNRAFIVLIPKTGNPENIKDYKPICLIGSLYKVLAKVLTDRIRKVMYSIIGETQMAFISNRQILDSLVIAEEIMCKWKNDKE
ncbi:hypothetical protein Ddye_004071 [Dipteronia dyeriana]|uniref:Reverse transcriptase domain-containing protein n=1 Tax=Dipteronia dyeriana TaxID=168575 RepID=A0AAD9XU10_9ROSI|nr:hypothetical protein Ddye_004071 [Dipteronia dyeriana]